MSKQLVRCGTSIGANIHEAINGQSRKDFLAKMYIAFKEATETEYWIKLLANTDYLNENERDSILQDCVEIKKSLIPSLKPPNSSKNNSAFCILNSALNKTGGFMSYTALYRRFRPQNFGDLVGQPHISRTLSAAVNKGSFVHAYLFCGPRGTGKTSTAKILARAVNCLKPSAEGEPCGTCPACLRFAQGESLDILEIDGASNRGIDEIRDLRERVKYAPAQEKYKVYIIDEVHMLTAPAFNALLKTLEEPPPHVLFILATTEPHKIPLTVLSRCQRFDFRRIADAEVEAHLARVAAEEGYTAEAEALALIARKVEGGLRDALSLLDQCASANNGHITVEALYMLTGAAERDFIAEMTRRLLAGQADEVLRQVAELFASGRDLRQFLNDLLEYQRELLLLLLAPKRQDVPDWAAAESPARLLKLLSALAEGDGRLRGSLQPRLTLELALLAACGVTEDSSPKSEVKSQSVAGGKAAAPLASSTPPPASLEAAPPKKSAPATPAATMPAPAAKEAAAPAPAEPVAAEPADELARLIELWPKIVQEVSRANSSTGAFLREAQPLAVQGNKLILSFGADYALFMNNICKRGPGRSLVEQKITAACGVAFSLEGLLAAAEETAPPPEEAPPEAKQESLF